MINKKNIFILFFILVTLYINSQKTDLEEYNLRGLVKKWTIEEYGYDNDNKPVLEKTIIYQINKHGYITKYESFNKKYNMDYKIKYIYNKKNLLQSLEYYHNSEEYYSKTEYHYDNTNHIKKMNQYNGAGNLLDIFYYTYDSHGNIISIEEKTPDLILTNIYTYKYNKENKITEYIIYTPLNMITAKYTYEYDKKGYLIQMTGLKEIETYEFVTDSYGNIIKEHIKVKLQKPAEGIYKKYKIHKYEYWK